ncbi:hypothetical protein [Sporisorium scitamineum]|uniref:PHD-type domain-containing protein n=1 Tax=Sporisorium scitamineum TaxID=49012 RepID=A0A0F7RTC3_9BASI|nr:hypothetical protein [Sporisorium scitamineum]
MQPGEIDLVKDDADVEVRAASSSAPMDVDLTPPKKRIKSAERSRTASAEPAALDSAHGWDADSTTVKAKGPSSMTPQSSAEPGAVKMEEDGDAAASALPNVEASSSTAVKGEPAPAEASTSAPTLPSQPEIDASTPQSVTKKKKSTSSSTTTKKEASSSSSTAKPKKGTTTKKTSTSSISHTPDTPSTRRVKLESPPPPTPALDDEDEDTALYCICQQRQDDVEGGMIMCDRCEQWYHYRCVGITEDDAELVDQFICPPCHGVTGEQTTYKAACARAGCRRAAVTLFSKYCSDRCGVLSVTAKMAAMKVEKNKKAAEVWRADGRVGAARKAEGFTHRAGGLEGEWKRVVGDQLSASIGSLGLADAFKMMVQDHTEAAPAKGLPNGVSTPATNGASVPLAQTACSATSLISIDEQHHLITQQIHTVDLQKSHLNARLDRLDLRSTLLHLVSDRVPTLAPVGSSTATAEADEEDLPTTTTSSSKKKKKSTKKSSTDTGGPRCGYDQRLHWDDPTFDAWARSPPGARILTHDLPLDGALDDSLDSDPQERVVCATAKRKCRRHLDWSNLCELALDAEKASLNADSRTLTQLRLGMANEGTRRGGL